ncbi:hypothetical protein [Micromonospora sp. NPDC047730]|uniref:hypothetical protein n=1 Tax=Micromonospora sp. NPDC047730 TaxID=3364253 RepID=UPI003720A766
MLRFSITERSDPQWIWTSTGRWRSGESWIEPIAHPALESILITNGHEVAVIARERSARAPQLHPWTEPGRVVALGPDAYHETVRGAEQWHLDRVILRMSTGDGVTLAAGVQNVAPIYLTIDGEALRGSWDLVELARGCGTDDLVRYMLTRTLSYFQRYSSVTHFRSIRHLTERAVARFQDGRLTLRYPPDALHAEPRQLHPDADVVDGLNSLLESLAQDRILNPSSSAVTLSGGMDSANVALTLGALHPGLIAAAAMLVDGDAGRQQRRRRRELVEVAKMGSDTTVHAFDYPPLNPDVVAFGGSLNPDEEGFADAIGQMVDQLAQRGIDTSFGGVGGDEMLALSADERDFSGNPDDLTLPVWLTLEAREEMLAAESEIAPASVVNEVTLSGLANHNALYLKRGIWPIELLAHPAAIRFGEWLPPEWRRRKRVFRERLRRYGASEAVVEPALPEDLGGLMAHGVYRHGLPMLRRFLSGHLLLGELGVVDPDRLRLAVDRAAAGRERDVDYRLYPVAATEVRLRRLAGLSE